MIASAFLATTKIAAGVIGNFERMVRIADGTGIPLDRIVDAMTSDFRAEFGSPVHILGEFSDAIEGVLIDGEPQAEQGYKHF